MFLNLWQYRQFIYSCVKRDFKAKYTGSVLGILWTVFQPLAMIFVYTVIFSKVMQNKLQGMEMLQFAYSIYLCSGILTWNLFQETLNSCINVFIYNGNLMKKVSFPRICLPAIAMFNALTNFIVGFFLFLLFLLLIRQLPFSLMPCFFVVIIVQCFFSVSIGVGLGVLNVFFRDIGQMINVVLQFWFWFTPIVYLPTIVPERLRFFLYLNPMYHIIAAYQNIFVYHKIPNLFFVFCVFLLSLIIGIWALGLYRKHVGELVDEL